MPALPTLHLPRATPAAALAAAVQPKRTSPWGVLPQNACCRSCCSLVAVGSSGTPLRAKPTASAQAHASALPLATCGSHSNRSITSWSSGCQAAVYCMQGPRLLSGCHMLHCVHGPAHTRSCCSHGQFKQEVKQGNDSCGKCSKCNCITRCFTANGHYKIQDRSN